MKYILVLTLLFSFSYTDEIKRIESIVKDITDLRHQHEVCQKELHFIKNKQVQKHKCHNNDEEYKKEITKLQTQIYKYKKTVKAKNKIIRELNNLKKLKKQISKNEICKQENLDKPNEFPKLVLKKEYAKYKIITTRPFTYRLKHKAKIYNNIDGNKIKSWKKGISFTTNIKAILKGKDSWLRVTGFFINGTWIKSQSQMWVKTKYAKKR